jgi:predicted dehydrogenase
MQTIGVIGSGNWGRNLVRILSGMDTVRLKYVADTSPAVIAAVATNYPQINLADDYHRILDDPGVGAVVVSAPAVHHYEIAKQALLAGKHTFVEKPMTLEVSHARELVELADGRNLKLMVGHLLLYHPCIAAVKAIVDSGEIGEIYYIYSQRLNLGTVRSDENTLYSLAPHDISVMLYLLGSTPTSVSASGQSYLRSGIEDVVFLTMKFPNRAIAHAHVSWLDPHKVRRTTVVGSRKMIVFDDMEIQGKVKIYDKGVDRQTEYGSYDEFLTLRNGDIFIPDIRMTEPLRLECAHFIHCIENGITPLSDGRNGLMVTRVLEAGQRSLTSGGAPVEFG